MKRKPKRSVGVPAIADDRQTDWRRLDNAAKIFPPTSTARDPKVFRFSCELTEPVDPQALERAAHRTLAEFPMFRYALRHGLFWYYLEDGGFEADVREEDAAPCRPLYLDGDSPLFRINYWGPRINFEVYHVLTDGTGALAFLRTLVCRYLQQVHREALQGADLSLGVDASAFQKMSDSFDKYYTGKRSRRIHEPRAYRLRGQRLPVDLLRVTIGEVPVSGLLREAHTRGTTLTVLLAACMLCAICDDMPLRERGKPVAASIPVNLRNFFDSETARNFFSVINAGVRFDQTPCELPDVITALTGVLEQRLTREYLQTRLNALASLEHNPMIRICPLALKDLIMFFGARSANAAATVSLSNVGRIEMPEALSPYLRKFDVFIATAGLQMCACSYGGILSLSFTSAFAGTDIERSFFRRLTALGLPVTISTNLPDRGEEEETP